MRGEKDWGTGIIKGNRTYNFSSGSEFVDVAELLIIPIRQSERFRRR